VSGGSGEYEDEAWKNVKIRCTSRAQGKWYRARQLAWRMVGRPVKPWECGEMIAAEVLSAIEMDGEAEKAAVTVAEGGTSREEACVGSVSGREAPAIAAAVRDGVRSTLAAAPAPSASSNNGSAGPAVMTGRRVLGERPLTARAGSMPPANSKNGSAASGPLTRGYDEMTATPPTCMARTELPAYLRSLLVNLAEADAFELDARLCRAVAFEQRLDAEIGALLALVAHEQLYRCHGFESLEAYAREHLGMAAGKARTLLRIERASGLCPVLRETYREGRLSWVQAGALVPVVLIPHGDLTTREAWVEWATKVSVRRLKDDVDRALLMNETEPEQFAATGGLPAEAVARGGNKTHVLATGEDATAGAATTTSDATRADATDGTTVGGDPTGDTGAATAHAGTTGGATASSETTDAATADAVSGGGANTGGSIENPDCFAAADRLSSPDRQIGAQPRVSGEDTCLFFHAPQSIATLFLAVLCTVRRRFEVQIGRLPTEAEGFEAMLDHVIDVWGGYGRRLPAAHRVFERDGWRCTVPGCSSLTNLHDHHIVFRSAGGSDDLSNRTTLCAWHHLRGVHGGVVRCVGKAPGELRFELGVRYRIGPLLSFGPGERRARA
jgi:hypothetical protein